MANVFLALPYYDRFAAETVTGILFASKRHVLRTQQEGGSILPHVFNQLWCAALRTRKKKQHHYYAMCHADVGPEEWWLDKAVAELEEHGADVMSVIMPIKDSRGATSTATFDADGAIRRLTMREAAEMPPTFAAADVFKPGVTLAVNTGLWVCRFTEEWVERVCWSFQNEIHRIPSADPGEDDDFRAAVVSEDWLFSHFCVREKLKVMATRKVRALHLGGGRYENQGAWGSVATEGVREQWLTSSFK